MVFAHRIDEITKHFFFFSSSFTYVNICLVTKNCHDYCFQINSQKRFSSIIKSYEGGMFLMICDGIPKMANKKYLAIELITLYFLIFFPKSDRRWRIYGTFILLLFFFFHHPFLFISFIPFLYFPFQLMTAALS